MIEQFATHEKKTPQQIRIQYCFNYTNARKEKPIIKQMQMQMQMQKKKEVIK